MGGRTGGNRPGDPSAYPSPGEEGEQLAPHLGVVGEGSSEQRQDSSSNGGRGLWGGSWRVCGDSAQRCASYTHEGGRLSFTATQATRLPRAGKIRHVYTPIAHIPPRFCTLLRPGILKGRVGENPHVATGLGTRRLQQALDAGISQLTGVLHTRGLDNLLTQ